MQINYNEFMSLIPEETREYVKITMKYLSYYIIDNYKIDSPNDEYYFNTRYDLGEQSNNKVKLLLSILLGLLHSNDTASLVKRHNISTENINFSKSIIEINCNEEDIFNRCYDVFCFLDDKTKYSTLTPSDIASNRFKKTSDGLITNLFSYFNINKELERTIVNTALNEHKKIDIILEQDLYTKLPYHTVNYINVASKIRSILIKKISSNEITENEYLKNDDNYLVPLSLLLAIYEYDGSDKNALETFLIANGLSLDAIYNKFTRYSFSSSIPSEPANMESVNILYKRYWTEGVNKDKTDSIYIRNIVANLFDRAFTKSSVIDRYLAIAKKSTDDFRDIEDKISAIEKVFATSKVDTETNEFYSTINKDVKEFIIFSSKVYKLLLKKIKDNKYNMELLIKDEDFVALSMYISSHFYNTELEEFFNYYNVSFDKVMALLNITITKEEIEQEILDKNILLDKFKKIVYYGINNNKNKENVSINDVSLNICKRDFINSMIIENIFEELRRDINLPNDFYNMLKKSLNTKRSELEKQEKEAFFKDLPIEDLEYLTNVCKSYNYLYANYKNIYDDELLVVLALLIGLNMISSNKTCELFEDLKLTRLHIRNHFDVKAFEVSGDLNIELLKTKFYKYIFEGRNKDNKSPTIEDIAFNIFNDELYKSIDLEVFLNKLNLSYDSFKEPKLLIEAYNNKKEKENNENEQKVKNDNAYNWINNSVSGDIRNWILGSCYTYNHLLCIFEENNDKYKDSLSKEKIEILSIILSFFDTDSKYREMLEKNNLNKEEILEKFNLPINYVDYPEIDSKDDTLANVFFKYCNNIKETKDFLENLCKNELFREIFNNFDLNFDILKIELINGKNYEDTLNIEERTAYLSSLPVPSIEKLSPMEITTCDNSLGLHATYIQDEYPRLMSSNELSVATSKILELTKGVFTENEIVIEPKGFLDKLLGTPPEIRKEIKFSPEVIKSLKPNLDIQINVLLDEANKLEKLKKYVETYRKKNKGLIAELDSVLKDYKEKFESTDKSNIFEISNLSSYISVLENKLNTLNLTDTLLMQEFFKLNQAIVNHCTTINSLILSRDVLIPLIGTELVVGNSISNELKSIDVTKNIVSLLNGLITKDIAGSEQILEKLKSTNISQEQLLVLSSAVTNQLNQIGIANSFGTNNTAFKIAPRDTTFDGIKPDDYYKKELTLK